MNRKERNRWPEKHDVDADLGRGMVHGAYAAASTYDGHNSRRGVSQLAQRSLSIKLLWKEVSDHADVDC